MVPTTQPKQYTAKDIERLDARGERYELLYGELLPMQYGTAMHGRVTALISFEISEFVRRGDLGECFAAGTGFHLTRRPDTVLAPDFAFVSHGKLAGVPLDEFVAAVPELVVETRQASDFEPAAKIARWLGFGVPVVIDLDPKSRVLTVHRPGVKPQAYGLGDTLDGIETLPDFSMPMSQLLR